MARYTKKELIEIENSIVEKYKDNKLPFLFHLCGGNEDQLIEIFNDIQDGDYVFVTHRNHYHAYLHGIDPEVVMDRVSNGRSMFIYDRERNFFSSAIVGGIPEIAAGVAMALKLKKSNQKVDHIIFLNVNKDTIVKRIERRKILEKRSDDDLNTILKRYDTYMETTKPVLDYYSTKSNFKEIDGSLEIGEITSKICNILKV